MNIRTLIITAACLAVSSASFAQKAKSDTIFFDDFNGKKLDRSKWNVEVTGHTNNDEQQAYVDSLSTVYLVRGKEADGAKHGALIIKAIYHPGYKSKENNNYDFLSGRLNTRSKFEFTHGTASCRMKMSAGAGMWPAFWALGTGKWPETGEIDVMETVGDSSWVSHALHGSGYFGDTPLTHRESFPAGTDVTKWHVYTVDWTENSLTFKIDGKTTYTVDRAAVAKYGKWSFDNAKFIILNFALGGGYPHGVNKIEKPYFGISESTVNKIKAGQAKVWVDWVLVTRNK